MFDSRWSWDFNELVQGWCLKTIQIHIIKVIIIIWLTFFILILDFLNLFLGRHNYHIRLLRFNFYFTIGCNVILASLSHRQVLTSCRLFGRLWHSYGVAAGRWFFIPVIAASCNFSLPFFLLFRDGVIFLFLELNQSFQLHLNHQEIIFAQCHWVVLAAH